MEPIPKEAGPTLKPAGPRAPPRLNAGAAAPRPGRAPRAALGDAPRTCQRYPAQASCQRLWGPRE